MHITFVFFLLIALNVISAAGLEWHSVPRASRNATTKPEWPGPYNEEKTFDNIMAKFQNNKDADYSWTLLEHAYSCIEAHSYDVDIQHGLQLTLVLTMGETHNEEAYETFRQTHPHLIPLKVKKTRKRYDY